MPDEYFDGDSTGTEVEKYTSWWWNLCCFFRLWIWKTSPHTGWWYFVRGKIFECLFQINKIFIRCFLNYYHLLKDCSWRNGVKAIIMHFVKKIVLLLLYLTDIKKTTRRVCVVKKMYIPCVNGSIHDVKVGCSATPVF
jgi:hypothetical protein